VGDVGVKLLWRRSLRTLHKSRESLHDFHAGKFADAQLVAYVSGGFASPEEC